MQLPQAVLRVCANRKCADHARWLLFVVFYAVVANVPFWAANNFFRIERSGYFCLEYAGVGLLALFLPGIFASALLLSVIATDLICGVSQTYYLPPAECFTNLGSLYELSGTRFLMVAAVTLLTLLVAGIAIYLPGRAIRGIYRLRAAACLIVFVALLISVDCVTIVHETGHVPNPFRLERPNDAIQLSYFKKPWLSRLPVIRLVRNEERDIELHKEVRASQIDGPLVPNAAAVAIRSAGLTAGKDRQNKPNLVVILVESWGLVNDSSIRSALAQPYFQPDLLARDRKSTRLNSSHW
jgi:hypothetical protein